MNVSSGMGLMGLSLVPPSSLCQSELLSLVGETNDKHIH
jgi:hypothetical protein